MNIGITLVEDCFTLVTLTQNNGLYSDLDRLDRLELSGGHHEQ
jgi:hypothetical protein